MIKKPLFIILIILGLLFIPFPINKQEYCSSNEIDLEMTNLYTLIFGYPHCYEYEVGSVENVPRGYCQEHNYTGWRYEPNSSVETCYIYNRTCETRHSWWWYFNTGR
jgi:hypothetical protein